MAAPSGAPRETLLILSDVHLGSDINDRAAPGAAPRRSKRVDQDLTALFRHYARVAPAGERWRAVIAGDFIDFIGMAIAAEGSRAQLDTDPSEEERAHGLGNSSDHARVKLKRVAERHAEVLAALAEFVAEGHALTIVHGNHDIEFHWEAVQDRVQGDPRSPRDHGPPRDRRERVSRRASSSTRGSSGQTASRTSSTATSTTRSARPTTSWRRCRRSIRGGSRAASPTCSSATSCVRRKGMKEHGHESQGLLDYISFAVGLGARGLLRLGVALHERRDRALPPAARVLHRRGAKAPRGARAAGRAPRRGDPHRHGPAPRAHCAAGPAPHALDPRHPRERPSRPARAGARRVARARRRRHRELEPRAPLVGRGVRARRRGLWRTGTSPASGRSSPTRSSRIARSTSRSSFLPRSSSWGTRMCRSGST